MKILALTTHAWNCEIWWKSLESVGHHVLIEQYDNRPHYLHSDIIDIARAYKPDFIVYAGAVEQYHKRPVLTIDSLLKLKNIAPTILICGDGRDERWWDLLFEYDARHCFNLLVNIDGSFETPIAEFDNGLVLLTPIDPRFFKLKPWADRSVEFGMVGRCYGPDRQVILDAATACGLQFFPGDAMRLYTSVAQIMCYT